MARLWQEPAVSEFHVLVVVFTLKMHVYMIRECLERITVHRPLDTPVCVSLFLQVVFLLRSTFIFSAKPAAPPRRGCVGCDSDPVLLLYCSFLAHPAVDC